MASIFLISMQSIAMMALGALIYGFLQQKVGSRTLRRSVVGMAFGIGAATAMMTPFYISEGVQADARGAFIAAATAFGGPIASIITSAISIAVRILIGGPAVVTGCISILLTIAASLAWYMRYGKEAVRSNQSWLLLCVASSLPSAIFLTRSEYSDPMVAVGVSLFVAANVLIFGKMLEKEQRRGRKEREMESAAITDILTGLPNRRAFEEFVTKLELQRVENVLLIILDIDHFKRINDMYGHDEGDNVLRAVGVAINRATRGLDFAARIGGEEFAVLMTTPNSEIGQTITERLQETLKVPYGNPADGHVTHVSAGAFHAVGQAFNYGVSYKEADQALYESKANGRNRVTFVSPLRKHLSVVR
ncbi:diguanylate cyclase domain-containing protein [Loktanella sp. DJP18]|uniref:GGDEF domain-containing protein n=1 Tax=Loktanella sp. DJP18 TaxID=3409788 RepID=UPI003BB6437D